MRLCFRICENPVFSQRGSFSMYLVLSFLTLVKHMNVRGMHAFVTTSVLSWTLSVHAFLYSIFKKKFLKMIEDDLLFRLKISLLIDAIMLNIHVYVQAIFGTITTEMVSL